MTTRDDKAMLAFATKWSRFGGGDEYILLEFGITPVVFYKRLLTMVTPTLINDVDFATRTYSRDFCSSKLARPGFRHCRDDTRSRVIHTGGRPTMAPTGCRVTSRRESLSTNIFGGSLVPAGGATSDFVRQRRRCAG